MIDRSLLLRIVGLVVSIGSAGCAQLLGADFDDPPARQPVEGNGPPASYLKAGMVQAEAQFGFTFKMDSSGLLVTAPLENEGTLQKVGATYYFSLMNEDKPPVRIVVPNAQAMDGVIPAAAIPQGFPVIEWGALRVALSEKLVVIGVPSKSSASTEPASDSDEPGCGAVYIYERAHLDWPVQTIRCPKIQPYALFGSCVSLSGSRLAVGASGEDNPGAPFSGAAYVYEEVDGRFDEVHPARLRPDIAHSGDQLGVALELEGDLLVAGAPGESSNSTGINRDANDTSMIGAGAAYVYRWSHDQWGLEAYVKSALTVLYGNFGVPISISDGRFAIGATGAASSCPDGLGHGGAAYVMGQTNGDWKIERCLSPSSGQTKGMYGAGLALLADRLVVGAPWDDSGSASNPMDISRHFSGAAYIYDRGAGGEWEKSAYLKAPNLGDDDVFGFGIALTPEHLAISAIFEAGGESGPNANMYDDSAPHAGAVYLYSTDSL